MQHVLFHGLDRKEHALFVFSELNHDGKKNDGIDDGDASGMARTFWIWTGVMLFNV